MRSCSSRIVVLTPTVLCCAALLRRQIAVWPHLTASRPCSRTNAVQSPAPPISYYKEAPLAVLANRAQQSCHLPRSSLQPTSAASQHPGQLRFREELMHQLLEQLPPDVKPRRHGGRPPPPNAPASIHSSELVAEERDCKQCSHRPQKRTRTNYVCSACQVHLCLGECFRAYHASIPS